MPRYDYRCAAGHTAESWQGFDVRSIDCPCGLAAQRIVLTAPGVTGFVSRPTSEAPIRFNDYLEAHGEMVRSAERQGIEAPDLWGKAKERIRRGEVKAIE